MPKMMTQNNYDKLVETIGEETMSDAANELREKSSDPNADNGILDIGVSCDGSWQNRGFSSLNGVVTVIFNLVPRASSLFYDKSGRFSVKERRSPGNEVGLFRLIAAKYWTMKQ